MTNKIVKNASWLVMCKIAKSVLGLVITMFTARFLGPSNYGTISYAASIVAFVLPIVQLGLNNILVEQTVAYPEEEGKTYGTAIVMSVCSAFLSIGGIAAFVRIANAGERETIIVCVLYSLVLVFQAIELINYWFQSKYLSKYSSIVSLIAYFLISLYRIYLLATNKSIYWFAVANAIDYLIISLSMVLIYGKKSEQKLRFSFPVAKRLFSKGRYYIVSSLMVTVFAQTDKIMLKLMIDETATGYYSVAVACASMTSFVFAAIIDSVRPSVFEGKKTNDKVYIKNLTVLYSIVIFLSLAQSVGMTILAKPIIILLYGAEYSSAVNALRIIVWYTTFSYLGSVRNIWILAEDKQKYLWIINLCGALMNVILNLILIPVFTIYGAAAASLITQIFTNVIIGFIIKPLRPNNKIMMNAVNPRLLIESVKKIIGK